MAEAGGGQGGRGRGGASRRALLRLGLVAGGTLLGLALVEILFRFLVPRYEYAAESLFDTDPTRLWGRRAEIAYFRPHPDTGERHLVINNNLALRQHRAIPQAKPPGEVRIGFFGDSMTENLRIAGPHSFTEVLDYLLNVRGAPLTVLNFGVDGYGTDQSYLSYRDSPAARGLDHVVYVFVWNDVADLYARGLFELTPEGFLRQRLAEPPTWWLRLLARLHVTYFVLEVEQRLFGKETVGELEDRELERFREAQAQRDAEARHLDPTSVLVGLDLQRGTRSEATQHYLALFERLLGRWRYEVEAEGGVFHVVVAPSRADVDFAPLFAGYRVLDLHAAFRDLGPGVAWDFTNDLHWNELGNQIGAVRMLRYFERELGMAALSEREVEERLDVYYRSFDLAWRPPRRAGAPAPLDEAERARIRARYAGLETTLAPISP